MTLLRGMTLALVATVVAAAPPVARAAPPTGSPTAAVSLGDSYISGEAGRWQGNSPNSAGSRDGTDRACVFTAGVCTAYDKSLVYIPPSDTNGCHRSDVAEIRSAAISVAQKINIACSGAVTANIWRAQSGGQTFKGELPQADQLATLARQVNVKLVVLSIGGNDLGFADIVAACVTAYVSNGPPCRTTQDAPLRAKMPTAMANVRKALDEIRFALAGDGYGPFDYRLELQSYPSVIPRAAENRYAEADKASRGGLGGCPFYDTDSDWARDTVVPLISDNLKAAALDRGAQFIDLRDAFQSREICATTTALAGPTSPPSPTTSDWGRFLSGVTPVQGDLQEAIHPNAYGQKALGTCVKLVFAAAPFDAAHPNAKGYACKNTPGGDTSAMTITPTP